MKKIYIFIWICSLLLVSGQLRAEGVDTTKVVGSAYDSLGVTLDPLIITNPTSPSFGLMVFQMIVILTLIAVLLYFLLYMIKRINKRYRNNNEEFSFKLLENFYFSQKQGISAIAFGGKLYIVGFSQNSVSVIDIIEDQEVIRKINQSNSETKFPEFFQKIFKGVKNDK
ncbi:MAG: flagellar biosynthetic protein FliO [Candidatus Cloacimonetes bacterium]|nr:flagellar biosynthetic protein FliO [Candidatus Cloacimonadota bacterium]